MTALHVLIVPGDSAGQRLDVFLSRAVSSLSRTRVQSLLGDGRVLVDGQPAKASRRICAGERVEIDEPPAAPTALLPEDIALDVLYEDASILVLNKAAGMVVHPGAGNPSGTVANAIRHRVPAAVIGGEERPGIVHRLDKDTSGVMVIALEEQAMRVLAAAFKAREVSKEYIAFCIGRPRKDRFDLVTGHRRDEHDRRRFTTKLPPPEGEDGSGNRRAHSSFEVLYSRAGASQLRVELHTGRTHQIRAQLADFGYPLLEDALYGGGHAHRRLGAGAVRRAVEGLHRQGLHAHRLSFRHPRSGAPLMFQAPLPADLAAVAEALVADDD